MGEAAVDVYDGCKIDYRARDVTPTKFIAVLTGDAQTAGGRVLQSKSEDHVFVNFVDHGDVGLIAFPDPRQVMHAKQLINTLQAMHGKGMYGQLTFYLETCNSGSMFQGVLPKSLPVYAVTAANAKESSWGTYCNADAKVAGKLIGSCLGDLFSVNWMMDSDKNIGRNETLKQQFARVKSQTNLSHVMDYGQIKNIGTEPVSDFQGPDDQHVQALPDDVDELSHASSVDARDIKLEYFYRTYLREGTSEAGDRLIKEILARHAVKELRKSLEASLSWTSENRLVSDDIVWTDERFDCHEQATMAFGIACGWTEDRLPLSRTLYNLCAQTSGHAAAVATAIQKACTSKAEIVI